MKFDTLYARTSTGAIQEWTIVVGNNYYTTTYGQKDGQLVTTDPSYCEGKNIGKANETSPENQAIKEAQAIYKKKKKEGYFENVEDIDKETFFQPQLAKKFVDYQDKVVYPLAVESKLNGVRCIFNKKGAFSRTGEQFHCIDHIKDSLAPLFIKYPDLILDGELFNPLFKNQLNVIASLVSVNRKITDVTEEDHIKAKEVVQYHVYDGFVNKEMMGSAFTVRKEALRNLLEEDAHGCIFYHPYEWVHSYEEIGVLMQKVKEENREGLMLKNPNGIYENKRSKNFLKLKVFTDDEFKVVEFLEGTGNWAGKVKKVVCLLNVPATNGKTTFESNIRGTMEELAELWQNRHMHIGKKVTVDFQEWSPYNIPLIPYCDPMFRDYE
jgi:DNA ligase-1